MDMLPSTAAEDMVASSPAAAPRPLDIESTGRIHDSGFMQSMMRKLSPASTDRAKIADDASKPAAEGHEGQESIQASDAAPIEENEITPTVAPAEAPTPSALGKAVKAKGVEAVAAPKLTIQWESKGTIEGQTMPSPDELVTALLGRTITEGGVTWTATRVVAEPTVVLTKLQSRKITSAGVAIGCGGVVLGGFLVLLLQALVGGAKGADQPIAPPSAPPPALPLETDVALTNHTCFEAQDVSSLTRAAFVPTFFNLSCIAGGGTGDPCDAQIAAVYTHRRFSALRFVRAPLAAYRMRPADAMHAQPLA